MKKKINNNNKQIIDIEENKPLKLYNFSSVNRNYLSRFYFKFIKFLLYTIKKLVILIKKNKNYILFFFIFIFILYNKNILIGILKKKIQMLLH